MCNHFIRYSMDDTVKEMREKRGLWMQCGTRWLRARTWADACAWTREHMSAVYAFAVTGTGLMRL